jgi:aspartate aminotransferase
MGDRRQPDVHLNLNVRGMRPSATVAINERCNELLAEGHAVHKLGLGQSPFPVPEPVVQELRNQAFQKDYLPVRGLRALRAAVAEYNHRSQGLSMAPEDVLVGPGSKELMFLLQLVYYGDLLIPTPSWVSYAPQAHIIGRKVHWLRTERGNGWRLTPDELEAACRDDPDRPRLVVLNYPSNPTGQTYEADELEALARVAHDHRIVLLSDEIYGELHHQGRHVSIARFYPEGTIVSSGLSKWCGAGGWRLGTFSFPRSLAWLLDAMAAVASETYTSTSAPIQYAAVRAFQGSTEIERYLWCARRILQALGTWCAVRLRAAGIDVDTPTSAFYLFVHLGDAADALAERGITTSAALCERLLEETGVAILPGVEFGRPAEELTARLAYVDFDGARALEAARQLPVDAELDETFLRTFCPSVTTAIDRMTEWLGKPAASAP